MKNLFIGFVLGIICTLIGIKLTKSAGSSSTTSTPEISSESGQDKRATEPVNQNADSKLPIPTFAKSMPKNFEPHQGELSVSWDPIPGVKRVRVFIFSKGQVIKTASIKNLNYIYIQQVPYLGQDDHVDYTIRLASVADDGKEGPFSEARPLRYYKDRAQMSKDFINYDPQVAPEIKAISVED